MATGPMATGQEGAGPDLPTLQLPPLALYVHVPWCVRKCPYCDFNSHAVDGELPERAYVAALLADLDADLPLVQGRELTSIFIGGGTPSLFSPAAYEQLFAGLHERLRFAAGIEITLEANPGTVEQEKFRGYRALGINRLSIGVQSFNPEHLQALGRIHGRDEAIRAADAARGAGFDNFNLDLMHGLPGQSVADAMADLGQALALAPTHLSWYQLTIEPNTVFHAKPPVLPVDDLLADIEDAGLARLADAGFHRYEISAYANSPRRESRHNRNYWEFGDYLGIGAGAHGKCTLPGENAIIRTRKTRLPKDYLAAAHERRAFGGAPQAVAAGDRPFEFMLNALRLVDGVPADFFSARTGIAPAAIAETLAALRGRGLLQPDTGRIACTPAGLRFLNDVVNAFAD
ncbi:MAG: radical SAM family heme chaperone HemW [Gammaproteobacteria bacterium]